MDDTATPESDDAADDVVVQILTEPAEGVPDVVADDSALQATVAALAAGTGIFAIDAERASGHRYSQRAYLIQIRRKGSGTHLIDPIPLTDLAALADVLAESDWILHAATQDLPCLRELGLRPPGLFDTELAGRLLGLDRVGLAGLCEDVLGVGLAKGHGAADWSKRPLPPDWLNYAALDVELLHELQEDLEERLRRADRTHWAQQEFAALLDWQPRVHAEPWRRTKGISRFREPRDLAVARELWLARDTVASRADQPPGRILADKAITAAVKAQPQDLAALQNLPEFKRQRRAMRTWWNAITRARDLPEEELPSRNLPDAVPPARSWPNRNPEAAAVLDAVRSAISTYAEEIGVAHEVLITPELIRTLVWAHFDTTLSASEISTLLADLGARPWQVAEVAETIAAAWPSPGE